MRKQDASRPCGPSHFVGELCLRRPPTKSAPPRAGLKPVAGANLDPSRFRMAADVIFHFRRGDDDDDA
jgi:hypothetical protein